jgi:cytoskeletal protein CcmA (bactofilin family)
MKKKIAVVGSLIALIIVVPLFGQAATFKSGASNYTLLSTQTVHGDLYTASRNVSIDGNVDGDLFVGGGQVRVSGNVTGDVFVGGGQVTIDGTIGESLRVAGGDVSLGGKVARNFSAAGGNISIERSATVTGDVDVAGGQITIGGSVGKVQVASGELTVTGTAKVNGPLDYTSKNTASIEQGSAVSGKVTHHYPKAHNRNWHGIANFFKVMFMLSVLLSALIFLWVLPRSSQALAETWRDRFPSSLLWGLLSIIVWPILAILLLITGVGIPLGIGMFMTYAAVLFLSLIVGAISLGNWVESALQRKAVPVGWLSAILGVILVELLGFVPILGFIILLLVYLAGLGTLVRLSASGYKKLRAKKQL